MMKRSNMYQDLELHRVMKEELEEERRLEAAGVLFSTQHPDSDAGMARKTDRHYGRTARADIETARKAAERDGYGKTLPRIWIGGLGRIACGLDPRPGKSGRQPGDD